mgnify:CR=1 FL=1
MMDGKSNRSLRLWEGRSIKVSGGDELRAMIRRTMQTLSNTPENPQEMDSLIGPSPSDGLLDTERMRQSRALVFGAGAVGGRNALLLAPTEFSWKSWITTRLRCGM